MKLTKKINKFSKVAKHEFDHMYRLSRDLFIDCEAAKNVFDKTCLSISINCAYRGVVQAIYHKPFGLLIFSEIQVFIL